LPGAQIRYKVLSVSRKCLFNCLCSIPTTDNCWAKYSFTISFEAIQANFYFHFTNLFLFKP